MTFRNYSAAEYRAAGIDAGPFALEGNPDPEKRNYRTSRRKPILGVVMHITVGLTDYTLPDSSAEGTTNYGANTTRDASWHVCTDSDGIIPSIRDSYVAWHAGVGPDDWSHPARPYINDATLGVEQGTSQVDWRVAPDWWVERTLRHNAVWLAPRVEKYKIPLVVVRDREVMGDAIMRGVPFGFISHATIAPHNRRDPGMVNGVDTYPWARLFTMIREELAGTAPQEEDMALTPEDVEVVRNAVWAKPMENSRGELTTAGSLLFWGYKSAGSAAASGVAVQAQLTALSAAVEALSTAQGLDPAQIQELIRSSVKGALDNLRIVDVPDEPAPASGA